MKTLEYQIKEQIENLSSEQLVEVNNIYARENNYDNDEVHVNEDDFFNTYFENNLIEAVRATQYGEYNFTDNWVKFNGYGNLDSFDRFDVADLCDTLDNIVDYAIENPSEFSMLDFDIEEESLTDED